MQPLRNATILSYVGEIALRHSVDRDFPAAGATIRELGPVGEEALALAEVVFVADKGPTSASDPRLPGVIVLSKSTLENQSLLTETLFHESIHQKLYATWIALPIVDPAARECEQALILPAWSGSPEPWSPDRALAAFHVYVHLCLLIGAERNRNSTRQAKLVEYMVRARALGEWVAEQVAPSLTPLGRDFVSWLNQSLPRLATVERAAARTLHSSTRSASPGLTLDEQVDGNLAGLARFID